MNAQRKQHGSTSDAAADVVEVEICVRADECDYVRRAVSAAAEGGAARVELCADMAQGGLTPRESLIETARRSLDDRCRLMVMIRPRGGDFCYDSAELRRMARQIVAAREAGADGVVLGALSSAGDEIDKPAMDSLIGVARSRSLSVTFHRAFDVLDDPERALRDILDLGVDRLLTAGVKWGGQGTALEGADRIARLASQAPRRIELVIGGGVGPSNVGRILDRVMKRRSGRFGVHAYSGVQRDGEPAVDLVRSLVVAANAMRDDSFPTQGQQPNDVPVRDRDPV